MRIFLLGFNISTSFDTSDELNNRWTSDFYQFQKFICSIQRLSRVA
jgi:hypothetical protein